MLALKNAQILGQINIFVNKYLNIFEYLLHTKLDRTCKILFSLRHPSLELANFTPKSS